MHRYCQARWLSRQRNNGNVMQTRTAANGARSWPTIGRTLSTQHSAREVPFARLLDVSSAPMLPVRRVVPLSWTLRFSLEWFPIRCATLRLYYFSNLLTHYCFALISELLWSCEGNSVWQPTGTDLWHGLPHFGPLCWRLQPVRLWGGSN